jgi:CelD/BcsL family acetyltransferase involved in cellulose biosynthesis
MTQAEASCAADGEASPPAASRRPLPVRLGDLTLWRAERRLVRIGLALGDVLARHVPALPPLAAGDDGYEIRSLPARCPLPEEARRMLVLERQRYPRHFIRLEGGFPAYMDGFSAKTRQTLRRKRRRWAEAAGGLDVRVYRTEAETRVFYELARALSARTYQERLLSAGLPSGPEALARMLARAAQDRSRAYILFHRGVPASYLYLPVENGCVLYAHLGYDPAFADLSPGTVLQLEALERLFAEARFAFFDFTEGDGAHKRLFGREQVECVDLLLLRPSLRNRALAVSLAGLEAAVRAVSRLAEAVGVKARLRRLIRR